MCLGQVASGGVFLYTVQIRFLRVLPDIIGNCSVFFPTLDNLTHVLSLLPAVLPLGFVQGTFLCQS